MFNQNRNPRVYAEIDVIKQTIDKANTANLLDILHKHNVNIDTYNRKACCPFPFHKGGNERSGSFTYYANTNSFNCYGCKTGGGPVEFIEAYSNHTLNKYNAAISIINNYAIHITKTIERSANHYNIYLEFSHLVRGFIIQNKDNSQAIDYAEYVSSTFDSLRKNLPLEPEGVNRLYTVLKKKLEDYK
jgi:DNA primase